MTRLRLGAAGLLVALTLAGCTSRSGPAASSGDEPSEETTTSADSTDSTGAEDADAPAMRTDGPCGYTSSPTEELSEAGLPEDPDETPSTGTVTVVLTTNRGDIPLTLDRAAAPCTVQSFEHLVASGFYDGIGCHRLTTSPGLKVLQCGDPNGDGSGGPGYTIPDEPPTDLVPVPDSPGGVELVLYPRGTVAMAKTQEPDSGGSQFFLVYADSTLPPEYTVFGTVDAAGLATVDGIAAAGVAPGGMSPDDGAPAGEVEIESATVGS